MKEESELEEAVRRSIEGLPPRGNPAAHPEEGKRLLRIWLETLHPTTVIRDRYNGLYSEGKWLAFPLYHDDVPGEANGCDLAQITFFELYTGPYGQGETPDKAFEDLREKVLNTMAFL